jgi:MFS family permease
VIVLSTKDKSSLLLSKKLSLILFTVYMLFGLAYSSYSYQLRYYAESNGIRYSLQSELESLSYLGVALFILFIGRISDSVGRERAVFVTSIAGSLSPLLAISSVSPTLFFLSVLSLNAAFLGGAVARNLLAIEVGGLRTGSVVGIAMMGTASAMVVGPIVGDFIKGIWGFSGVFLFSSTMFALSALLPLSIRTSRGKTSSVGPGIVSIPKELRGFAAFAILDRFAYYIWVPLIFALTASEGISIGSSALLYSVQNASWLVLQFPLGIIADKINPKLLLSFSEVTTSLSAIMLVFGLSGTGGFQALSLAFALLGINVASWAPSYNSLFMKKTMNAERGKYLAAINFYATLGAMLSPFIGGLLRSTIPGGFGHLIFAAILHAANAVFILKIK